MRPKVHSTISKIFATLFVVVLAVGLSFGQRDITGKVTDAANGDPLIGANVQVKGTTFGTITDIDGNFKLSVADQDEALLVSYLGYTTQEVPINDGGMEYNIQLTAGEVLDEIVVVGYGTVKKKDLTGAVTSIKSEDFVGGLVNAPNQLIQGKVPGVQILNNGGAPGAITTVRIRGNASVRTGGDPLYVVDGVPLDGRSARPNVDALGLGSTPGANPLLFIPPNLIESMEVLKDASAAAIYGARGSNGVIIITTKKGQAGPPVLEFGASVGVSSVLKKYDVLDAAGYRSALTQYDLMGDAGGSSDAFDEVTRSAISQRYNMSIRGGSERGSYRVSAGWSDVQGVIKNSGLKTYYGSVAGEYKFFDNDRVKIDFNVLASHNTEDLIPDTDDGDFTGDVVAQALQWNPTRPLRLPDGSFDIELGSTTINPLAYLSAYKDQANTTSILANISPTINIVEGLDYKFLYSVNHNVGNRALQIKSFINVQGVEGRGWAVFGQQSLTSELFTHTLSYNKEFDNRISLNAVAGYEYQEFSSKFNAISGQDFLVDDVDYISVLNSSSVQSRNVFSGADPVTKLQSYFTRANVGFVDGRYLLTATVRADGSSKFGENNRYGIFPSFAFAWNITDENFMANGPFDNLKLRASWGQVGNQEFPAGASQERYAFGDDGELSLINVANPDLQWEVSQTVNIGVDFGLFDYRLSGSIDYFYRKTTDLLFNFSTIQPAPASRYWVNLDGEVINAGLELGLTGFIIDNDKVTWDASMNLTYLSNKLQNYEGPPVLTGALHGQGITGSTVQRLENGQPLNSFYVREWLGIDPDTGLDILTDDGNTMFYLGDPNPDFLLGINSSVRVGNFDAMMSWNGAFGHQVYNNTANTVLPIGNLGSRNIDANLLDMPVQENIANSIKSSSRYLEDADFMKLTNLTLGYTFNDVSNVLQNARIYVTGQNLLLITGYSGFDPEVNSDKQVNGVPSFGIEYSPFPSARSVILGVNLTF